VDLIKQLWIRGCPHGGTRYTVKFLQTLGVDVGHETGRPQGIVDWRQVITVDEDIGLYLHQTRNPLDTIASFFEFDRNFWKNIYDVKEIRIYKQGSLLHRSMSYYYLWNYFVEKNSFFSYPVEDIQSLIDILDLFKFPYDKSKKNEALSIGRQGVWKEKDVVLTYDDLFNENEELGKKIYKQAERYGYVDV